MPLCFAMDLPITRRQILDSSKLKKFANDNFKFDKNGRKLSIQVVNTGKMRNCSLRAISPFPTVFSKGLFPRGVKRCRVEWVKPELMFNPFPNKPTFLRVCNTSRLKTLGKGEIARNEQFLLFPQSFVYF